MSQCIVRIWCCLTCLELNTLPHWSHGKHRFKWWASICFFKSVLCPAVFPQAKHSQVFVPVFLVSAATWSSIAITDIYIYEPSKPKDGIKLNSTMFLHTGYQWFNARLRWTLYTEHQFPIMGVGTQEIKGNKKLCQVTFYGSPVRYINLLKNHYLAVK